MRLEKHQDWTPQEVMAALAARGTNMARLAAQYGCSRQALHQTLRAPNARGELRIAHALGLHPMAIWPSRYHPDGEPRYRRLALKPVPDGHASQCNAAAAEVNGNLREAA